MLKKSEQKFEFKGSTHFMLLISTYLTNKLDIENPFKLNSFDYLLHRFQVFLTFMLKI